MSRIFDALQKSESEAAASETAPEISELLVNLEHLRDDGAQSQIKDTRGGQEACCRTCGSPIGAVVLFCPHCDTFQGSVL
jgi:hypothetical protein